jgi:hypothetical protein
VGGLKRRFIAQIFSAVASDRDSGKFAEGRAVRGQDRPSCRSGGCGDHEVMRSPWSPFASHGDEKLRVGFGDIEVVINDWDRCDDVLDEVLPLKPRRTMRKLDAHQ